MRLDNSQIPSYMDRVEVNHIVYQEVLFIRVDEQHNTLFTFNP